MADGQIPDGFMEDGNGSLVPVSKVKPEHLIEDELVKEIAAAAVQLNVKLAAFKKSALEDVAAHVSLIAEKYGVERGGKKGNLTLSTFDGRLRVRVAVNENLAFGPELTAAKALIDECVTRWSEGANDNIRALVEHAFQTNKAGRIDTARVLGLRRLNIEDAEWKRAMDAISDAVRPVGSKTYVRVYRVNQETGDETPIALDLASV